MEYSKEHPIKILAVLNNTTYFSFPKSFDSIQSYMQQFPSHKFLDAMSCFHFLIFLVTNQAVHFDVIYFSSDFSRACFYFPFVFELSRTSLTC